MINEAFKPVFISLLLFCSISVFSQGNADSLNINQSLIDSVYNRGVVFEANRKKPDIKLSTEQAIRFLQERHQAPNWNSTKDPFRRALGQLIYEASFPPFDSSENFLKRYPYDSINISWDKFYIWEPMRIKVPYKVLPELQLHVDSIVHADTNGIQIITDSLKIRDMRLSEQDSASRQFPVLKDTTLLVIIDTLHDVKPTYPDFPFNSYSFPYQADSLQVAIVSLLKYVEGRDSSIISFTGLGEAVTPVWLNSRSDIMMRYWLKNELDDSVTVWIGTPSRNTIGLYLEKGVSFRRPMKQSSFTDARIDVKTQDKSKLLGVQRIITKPQYWKYRSEASFLFSQSALSNWVKGGENNISMALDMTGYADYNNKQLKLSSNNFARLKFGYIALGDNPIRKNLDLFETNSKLNHKAFGKFDFSTIMLFKTQIARGFNYPNDSVPVSKLLNPAVITIGFGLDYKPNKTTSLNFSPLSYKGTFVWDTATIDQTKYGIAKDRRSLNEPGASLMISNEYKPIKTMTITNRLQLFTNYVNKPQNIDVDWEMIVVANINWFTDVRFNAHLIFDDDTKTVVLDKDKKPLLDAAGKQRKTSRIQFKEMLGFSFVFRF
jgi:hypothetical protein